MPRMTTALYRAACSLAGEHRSGFFPVPYRIAGAVPHRLPRTKRAVYIAVDDAGTVRYVGSVCRGGVRSAVTARLAEHVRDWWKERHWTHLYVVPLADTTPSATVKRIEGRIGRRLCPADNRRLPRR